MVTNLLLELNDEVKGVGLDEDPVELIEKSPEFFSKFSCVVATDLPEQALLKLASELWTRKIPLCVGRAYGMIGMWRNVLPEVCIIESRPEYSKENYRLARCAASRATQLPPRAGSLLPPLAPHCVLPAIALGHGSRRRQMVGNAGSKHLAAACR